MNVFFRRIPLAASLGAVALAFSVSSVQAQETTLNIYSARHYQTDEKLYDDFAKKNNVKVQRVDTDDVGVVQRLMTEGSASPADIVLLVDAARLTDADDKGLFAPIKSEILEKNIPQQYRAHATDEGTTWFGFSRRARVIVYNKEKVKPEAVANYEQLADPANKGKVCTRTGSHPYNLSLFSVMATHLGEKEAEQWLQGVVDNMARAPKGGDTDQIRAVASGECQIALSNSYYYARLMRSDKPADREVAEKAGVVFPNQASWGTHMNIAGGAVAKHSKNKELAKKFLEYLATPEAQRHFADRNNEWPVAVGVKLNNPALETMTGGKEFKVDETPLGEVGKKRIAVQQMLDRVGYQ